MKTSVFLKRNIEPTIEIEKEKKKKRFSYVGKAKLEAEVISNLFKAKVVTVASILL